MGFTRHVFQKRELSPTEWEAFSAGCRAVAQHCSNEGITLLHPLSNSDSNEIRDDEDRRAFIAAASWFGTQLGEGLSDEELMKPFEHAGPVFTSSVVAFADARGVEPFWFPRAMVERTFFNLPKKPRQRSESVVLHYCKTSRHPYDLAVGACYRLAVLIAPEAVSMDASAENEDSIEAYALAESVFQSLKASGQIKH